MARYATTFSGERRTAYVGVQLTPAEKSQLRAGATKAGASLSQFVRELCLGCAARPPLAATLRRDPDARALIYELKAIGNNINQLARIANATRLAPQMVVLVDVLTQLKTVLTQVMTL